MITYRPLPFFNERKLPISMLVIHSMAHNAGEGIAQLEKLQLSTKSRCVFCDVIPMGERRTGLFR